jgi:hypothetical protein
VTTEQRIRGLTDEELISEMREYANEDAMPLYRVRIILEEAADRIEKLTEGGEDE